MKKHLLFYSLLTIFIATAVVTLLGVMDKVTVKEPYLGWLVAAFLVELAAVIIALFKGTDFFSEEAKVVSARDEKKSGDFDKDKIAQIFWLGADMHSLLFHLEATGDVKGIRFYLRQANSHLGLSGLNGHALKELMEKLYREGRTKTPAEWTPQLRKQYAQTVRGILTKIVALIEHQQGPSFVGEVPDSP